jgi:membrane-associated phospholipid phosphatase
MAVAASAAVNAPWVAAGPILFVALFVAASRVYLRVHYVTDVVVGLGLGIAGALLGQMIV